MHCTSSILLGLILFSVNHLTEITGNIICYTSSELDPNAEDPGTSATCGDNIYSCYTYTDLTINKVYRGCGLVTIDKEKSFCDTLPLIPQNECGICWTDNCNGKTMNVKQCHTCDDTIPNGNCSLNKNTELVNCPDWKTCYEYSYMINSQTKTVKNCGDPLICLIDNNILSMEVVAKQLDGNAICKTCEGSLCNANLYLGGGGASLRPLHQTLLYSIPLSLVYYYIKS